MSCLGCAETAFGYLPMELHLPVKHVQSINNHSLRSLETACGKVASNIAFSCIPLFQPPKALSLAPHIFPVRAVTAETGQAGEQTGTRTDWIISGRTLMLAICAAQCMAAALKYWTRRLSLGGSVVNLRFNR
ncbi:hypothetical protein FALCPG4_005183 [Fusarium falciforme]